MKHEFPQLTSPTEGHRDWIDEYGNYHYVVPCDDGLLVERKSNDGWVSEIATLGELTVTAYEDGVSLKHAGATEAINLRPLHRSCVVAPSAPDHVERTLVVGSGSAPSAWGDDIPEHQIDLHDLPEGYLDDAAWEQLRHLGVVSLRFSDAFDESDWLPSRAATAAAGARQATTLREAMLLIREIASDDVNAQDECETWLREFDVKNTRFRRAARPSETLALHNPRSALNVAR